MEPEGNLGQHVELQGHPRNSEEDPKNEQQILDYTTCINKHSSKLKRVIKTAHRIAMSPKQSSSIVR